MRTLIVGAGEVGKSLYQVLKKRHEAYLKDVEPLEVKDIEILNICIPYSDKFEEIVKSYQQQYYPKLTIIHSTVPPGTSRKLGAIHSPIHGRHPNLAGGIKTFVKYIGGSDPKKTAKAQKFLRAAGIKTKVVSSQEASELSKLWCTTRLGWEWVFMKEVAAACERWAVPFDEVYGWAKYYNEGYRKLGFPDFQRSVLKDMPGKCGGHCVINNCKIISDEAVADLILKYDASLQGVSEPNAG